MSNDVQRDKSAGRLEVIAAMLTDRGLVRSSNQDAVAYVMPQDDGQEASTLAVLADGMGGHLSGEIASAMAIETILECFYQSGNGIASALAASFEAANLAIRTRAETDPACAGMGTTCTTLAIHQDDAYLAHIGDSRAYMLRDGQFSQISEDHSVVARLVRDGVISRQEAQVHPERNVILQALGTALEIHPQYWKTEQKLETGDRFLLCSDGLSDLVDDTTMANAITQSAPIDACRTLIEAALAAGGHDNISVGVIELRAVEVAIEPGAAVTRPRPAEPKGD